jgi:drug/metabolite transporter (DMT)-like permease
MTLAPSQPRLPAGPAALLVSLCVLWGFAQVLMKLGGEGISPMVQAGARSAVAFLLVLAWCRWRGIQVLVRDGSLGPGLLGGLFFALEFWALFAALQEGDVSRCTVLLYTAPFWAVLGAHLLVPGDKLTPRKLAGLGLAFGGLLLAFADRLSGGAAASLRPDLLGLAAGMLWGFTIVTMKASVLSRIAPERTLLYQLGVSALLLPLGFVLGEPGFFDPRPAVLASFVFQCAAVAFASYIAWFWLVRNFAASAIAPFMFLTPVSGVALGAIFYAEPLAWPVLGALALIGAGIWVVNRA